MIAVDVPAGRYVYASLGKGKFHIADLDTKTTVCGRPVPDNARTTMYSPGVCHFCKTKATDEQRDAAERSRRRLWEESTRARDEAIERNRRGVFTVYRCKKCGVQHQRPGKGPGVPYCMGAHHEADLEPVEVTGPPFRSTDA